MSEAQDGFLPHRIRAKWQWMQENSDDEITEQDALDALMDECGQTEDGACLEAGSEYCEFECPFRDARALGEEEA